MPPLRRYAPAQLAVQLQFLRQHNDRYEFQYKAHRFLLPHQSGHGLHYQNVQAIAAIPEMVELNIGHAIIGRAVFSGLPEAVAEMKRLMLEARL